MTIWFSASCSLTILPNSVGLPALPLRNDLSGRLEQADDLALGMGVTGKDARLGLAEDLLHQRHRAVQLATQPFQHGLPRAFRRRLDAIVDLPGKALGLTHHSAGGLK